MMHVLGNVYTALLLTKCFHKLIEKRVSPILEYVFKCIINVILLFSFGNTSCLFLSVRSYFKTIYLLLLYTPMLLMQRAQPIWQNVIELQLIEHGPRSSKNRVLLIGNYQPFIMVLNKLAGKQVIWYTDSKNCISIIEKGSLKSNLVISAYIQAVLDIK